jgi:uncharacterized membrane protein YGL010W
MAKTYSEYMAQYALEHTKRGTKLTHMVGIPLVALSVPVAIMDWRAAIAMFVVGWIFQLVGHRIEGNRPAFLSDPLYLLVGVAWVCREFGEMLGARRSPNR